MKIIVGNTEVLTDKTITIEEELLNPSSLLLKNVYPKSWETTHDYTQFWFPEDFSKCSIYDNNDNLIWAGIVRNTGNVNLSPYQPHFVDLQVIDFKTLLSEGKTYDFVLTNITVNDAITKIINEITDYGFKEGNVFLGNQGTQQIQSYSTEDQTAYDLLQYISEITGSIWFTRFDPTDENVYIDFYLVENLPKANSIEFNENYFKTNDIRDISYNYSTSEYRNRQIINSNEVGSTTEITEYILTNGISSTFMLERNVFGIASIDVYINNQWVSKTFTTQEQKDLGVDADFYYTKGNNELETEVIYDNNTRIRVIFYPYVRGREVAQNINEINRITTAIGRNGTLTRYEDRNDVESTEELQQIAQTYLKFKGRAEIDLTIISGNGNLFNIGDSVYFNAPLNDLKLDYVVKAKKSEIIINDAEITPKIYEQYEYTLNSNYNEQRLLNFFDNQRRKVQGNLQEGDIVERDIDVENTLNIIFDNFNVSSVSLDADNNNELEFKLNGGLTE